MGPTIHDCLFLSIFCEYILTAPGKICELWVHYADVPTACDPVCWDWCYHTHKRPDDFSRSLEWHEEKPNILDDIWH